MFDLEDAKTELKRKLENADVYTADNVMQARIEDYINNIEFGNITDLLWVWTWVVDTDLEDQLHDSGVYESINDTVIGGLVHIIDGLREDSFDFARKLSLNKQ